MNVAASTISAGPGATFSTFFSKSTEALMKQHGKAFERDEVVMKVVMCLIISIGVLLYTLFALPLSWWVLAIVPAGTVLGAVAMTATHVVASVVKQGFDSIMSIGRSLISGAKNV